MVNFLENKYSKLYFRIIEKAKINSYEQYTETHHIIPKCFGGPNTKDNLITFSAREHFICHFLLTKMFTPKTKEWRSMIYAFNRMRQTSSNQNRYFNSKLFETARKEHSKIVSEKMKNRIVTEKTKLKLSGPNNGMYGKNHSKETKEKMSKNMKGKRFGENHPLFGKHHSKETKEKMSVKKTGENNPFFGKNHSEETKLIWSKIRKGQLHKEETKQKLKQFHSKKVICPHCQKEGSGPVMRRFHLNNCKLKPIFLTP